MERKRVVVTGLGLVSPIGNDISSLEENLKAGKNGIDKISYFPTDGWEVTLAAEIEKIDFEDHISKKEMKRMDRSSAYAIIAARQALKDSGLDKEYITNNPRVEVQLSSGIGGIITIQEETERAQKKGYQKVSPFFIPKVIANMSSARVSIDLKINGGSYCPVTACAGGTNAIGNAFKNIRDGYADISFAGGTEASICELGIGSFSSMRALSTSDDPNRASIPFDLERDGFVMGEGSAVLVLEELNHALDRGADIYAEVIGYGVSSDASHITAPNEEGKWAANAMEKAIEDAGINPSDVTTINAHGTSTELNDLSETRAIKLAFGDSYKDIYVTSTKSMTGHLLGAAGALEGLISVLQIKNNFIAPTINLEKPDPDCDLNIVANEYLERDVKVAMSNSLGFGGHNFSVIFREVEE